jgi:hypothetical protein
MNRPSTIVGSAVLAMALFAGACGGPSAAPHRASPKKVAQPSLRELPKITRSRVAPDAVRVDLAIPTFSYPTQVTNPLFPIADLHSAVLLSEIEGEPGKVETTLLPETKTVEWNGEKVEALQSQFVAYLKGRILEVAVDLYAQDDDGSVWYFGEDVVDYEKGVAASTEGTWRVGVDGPAAMIMPAHPKVGDVFRTENIPQVAWEEVTVKKVGQTVDGPTGPITGAMIGEELHMEGDREPKTFAPGYGEFYSGSPHDFEANALAIPADATAGAEPVELEALSKALVDVFEPAQSKDWKAVSAAVANLTSAEQTLRTRELPKLLKQHMHAAVDALDKAADAHKGRQMWLAAFDVAGTGLDLQLRYRPVAEIDKARLDLMAQSLLADATANDARAVKGDVTTLKWIRDRVALDATDAQRIDDKLRYLDSVADAKEFGVMSDEAMHLRKTIAGLRPQT